MKDFTANLLIAGCGVSGRAAARLAADLDLDFCLADEKDTPELRTFAASLKKQPSAVVFGWKEGMELPAAERIILSPGIRKDSAFRKALGNITADVAGELEFALEYLPCPFVAITGTNGKTTVTELTTALLQAYGVKAAAAGNIGEALSDVAVRAREESLELAVVEISSFQLETIRTIRPAAAAILNIASDHIDRHQSMEDYIRTKFKLVKNMKSGVILNHNLRGIFRNYLSDQVQKLTFSIDRPTAFYTVRDGIICRDGKQLIPLADLALCGRHNTENILAALALLDAIKGVGALRDAGVQKALKEFRAGDHRIQMFLEKDGVRYYDDSKATNPHAVNAALDMLGGGKAGIVLLLGGQDKQMDFRELLPHLGSVRLAVCLGEAGKRIAETVSSAVKVRMAENFEDAVNIACSAAKKGDAVLLSPACASFDMFKSYQDRGDTFQRLVRAKTAV